MDGGTLFCIGLMLLIRTHDDQNASQSNALYPLVGLYHDLRVQR
jgi:hypothetical protein